MRVATALTVACLVAVLLVASCEGSWNKAADKHAQLAKAFKSHPKLSSPLKKVKKHGFKALQTTGAAPTCNATGFAAAWNATSAACDNIQFPDMDKFDANNKTQVDAMNMWCSSAKCGGQLSAMFDNTDYVKCLTASDKPEHAVAALFAFMGKLMCFSPPTDANTTCMTTLSNMDGDEEKCQGNYNKNIPTPRNGTQCRMASKDCVWNQYERRCNLNTTRQVQAVCRPAIRECTGALVALLTSPSMIALGVTPEEIFNGEGPDVDEMNTMLDLVCVKGASGDFCYPVVDALFQNDDKAVQYICNDNKKFQCLKAVAPVLKKSVTRQAEKEFFGCVKMCKNQTVCVEDYMCGEQFAYKKFEASMFETFVDMTCARNKAGKWCMTVFEEHEDIGNRCAEPVTANYTKAGSNGVCNEKCNKEIKVALDDIGCCMNQQFVAGPAMNMSDFPMYVKNNSMTRAPTKQPLATQMPTEGSNEESFIVESLALCSNIGQAGVDKIKTEACPKVDTITTVDPCFTAEWDTILQKFATDCDDSSTQVFEKQYSSDSVFAADVDGFCKGSCKKSVDIVLSAKWRRCMPESAAKELSSTTVFCEKDMPNGTYCAVAARSYEDGNCDKYDNQQSMCTNAAQCAWVGGNDGCEINPTVAYLEKVCNPCLAKIANALGGAVAAEASFYQQFICAKADNKFCYPLVASEIAKIDGTGFQDSTLANVCSNSTKESCMVKMMSGAASMINRQISTSYRQCAQTAPTQSYLDACVSNSAGYFREVSRMSTQTSSMCRKNANGHFCMSLLNGAMANPCLQKLLASAPTCDVACNTNLTGMIGEFGCCVGNIHQMVRNVHVAKDQFPTVANKNGLKPNFPAAPKKANVTAPTPVPAGSKFVANIGEESTDNGMFVFTQCAGLKDSIKDSMALQCARAKGEKKIEKKKSLPISFKKIKDDPVLEKRLIDGLVGDTASALGVPSEDLVNPRFEEDTNAQVVTSKRRFGTLATSSGTIFAYEIQSTSDEATQALSDKLDQLSASDELVYPTATEVVSDCGCKDETVASLAVAAPPIVTAAPDPAAPVVPAPVATSNSTSGSAVVSVAAALVAMVAAMMF